MSHHLDLSPAAYLGVLALLVILVLTGLHLLFKR
jgi:thiosulfate reductase cytochrome b subunit